MERVRRMLFIVAVFLVYFFMKKESAYAGTYDNAYSFYHQFKGTNLMQAYDGYIYVGSRGGVAASSSSYLYNTRGHRFSLILNGTQYYIDIKRGLCGGVYDQSISDMTVGRYVYNLYRIPYQSICQLLQYNYPFVDFGVLYQKSQTVVLSYDSIMTIKKRQPNGTYSLFGDLSNDLMGRPPTWGNVYFDQDSMERAWRSATRQRRSFANFYHLQIIIPGLEKGTFLTTTPVQVKEEAGVFKKNGVYFVKAGKLVEYSYMAQSSFASTTFQPNYMFLDLYDINTFSYLSLNLYAYAPTGRIDGSVNNPISHRVSLESCIFERSDLNRSLSYIGKAQIVNDGERIFITPRSAIFLNGICQVESVLGDSRLGVHVISDGKGPVISTEQTGNMLTIRGNDIGSGLDYMTVFSENGIELMRSNNQEMLCPITKDEVYKIVGVDRVGNQEVKYLPVEFEEEVTVSNIKFRFISEEFLDKDEDCGGLKKDSLWRTDSNLQRLLKDAVSGTEIDLEIQWDEE